MKSVQIRSFFWPVFFCIQTEYRKIRTRKNPCLDIFHTVLPLLIASSFNLSIIISYSSSLPNFAYIFPMITKEYKSLMSDISIFLTFRSIYLSIYQSICLPSSVYLSLHGPKYSKINQVKFVEDSL